MKRRPNHIVIVVDRKATLVLLAAAVLLGGAGILSSQQLTMTATYPIPAGVYNQIVTTGDSGTVPANTTLNRNRGNTILVPPTNAAGKVGIGTATPASRLSVAGGVQFGDDVEGCSAAKAGTARWHSGALEVCTADGWQSASAIPPGTLAGGCVKGKKGIRPALKCNEVILLIGTLVEATKCDPGWTPTTCASPFFKSGPISYGCCAKI